MTKKEHIRKVITAIALLLAASHILFPKVQVDIITVILFAIAIIPWLEPLFKSVELPGGLKLEFQDLKKLEEEAKEAGLIKPSDEAAELEEKEPYIFVEIAEKNQELALVSLRIEIEKRLREIAEKYSIKTKKYSILKLIETLAQREILTPQETASLKDMVITLNQAAHGVEYDQRNAEWVIEYGSQIIDSLNNKLEYRGGRISHSNPEGKLHWIDKSYQDCDWVTNLEWGECISKHTDLWEKELINIYTSLLNKLRSPQKEKLIETQENWKKQFELEKEFIYSFEDMPLRIGREGMFITADNFMNKIRERALELEEVLAKLV